jgi:hypothetical protein
MSFPAGEQITVTRPVSGTGFDDSGDPVSAAPITFVVDGVGVAPGRYDETQQAWGFSAENEYTLYLPYGTDLRATDLVSLRGESGWQVVADVRVVDWRSPFTGWEPGTVAVVRRAS